jgi:hypothetical protein
MMAECDRLAALKDFYPVLQTSTPALLAAGAAGLLREEKGLP